MKNENSACTHYWPSLAAPKAVAAQNLPKPDSKTKAAYEALGFTFGEAADDLFVKATLPSGWKIVCTDHVIISARR